jgi:hypothetical protein
VNHRAAAYALCCIVALIGAPGLADAPHLRAGDTLTYDITVQMNERSATQRGPAPARNRDDSSAGAGMATVQIVGVDPDGTANGNLTVDLLGFSRGQPVSLHKSLTVKVSPNGEIHPSSAIDPLLDQTFALADQSIRDIASRNVHAQPNWQWRLSAAAYPMIIAFNRTLRGEQTFQGLPTLVVQTVGGGDYTAVADPVQASVALSGTYYYDQRDGLFVGQAMRSDSSVSDATSGDSVDSSTLVTIVLRSFARATTQPTPSPSAPAPEETALPSPEPTVVPTELSPVPLPTVTPRTQ